MKTKTAKATTAKTAKTAKARQLYTTTVVDAPKIVAAAPKPTPTAGEVRLAKLAVVTTQREDAKAKLGAAAKQALAVAAVKPAAIEPKKVAQPAKKIAKSALTGKITLLVKKNPKRGESAKRFANYKTGMTTEQALEKGLTNADLGWDVAHGFISIK